MSQYLSTVPSKRVLALIACALMLLSASVVNAQRTITLEESLRIASTNAPSLQQARRNYESASETAEAENLSLRSKADLTLFAPLYTDYTSPIFNPATGLTDLLSQRSIQYGGVLSINQPIYWTGGSLAFQGSVYKRGQTASSGAKLDDILGLGSISLNQPLFKANELKLTNREAEIALDLARASYRSQWASLNYRIKSLFFSLYQAAEEVKIQRDEVASSESAYTLADNKLKAGLIAEVDALQLEVDLAAARTDLFDRERRLLSARRDLLAALGMPMSEKIEARMDSLQEIAITVNPDEAVAKALASRVDVLSAKYDMERQDISIQRLDGQRSINASLTGNFGLSNDVEEFGKLTQNPFVNRGLTLSINIPLLDWGAHSLRMDAAKSMLESNKIESRIVEDRAEQDVRSAIEQLESARKQAEVARKSVAVAQKAYDLSRARFDSGKITSQDLSLAQQRLTRARLSALTAMVAEHLGIADVTQKTLFDYSSGRAIELPSGN